MASSPSVTEAEIMLALWSFLGSLDLADVDPDDIIQSQVNRVQEPKGANFIVMTPTHRRRLSTNTETWDTAPSPAPAPTEMRYEKDTELTVQLDIHGPFGADNATVIATLWRSAYACNAIDRAIFQPLHASDGHQTPFVNAEKQYENRWVMSLVLQANPSVSTEAQFADTIDVNIVRTGP